MREPKGSSSGRQLFTQAWYGMLYMYQYRQSSRRKSVFDTEVPVKRAVPYLYIHMSPKDEPTGLKYVEEVITAVFLKTIYFEDNAPRRYK